MAEHQRGRHGGASACNPETRTHERVDSRGQRVLDLSNEELLDALARQVVRQHIEAEEVALCIKAPEEASSASTPNQDEILQELASGSDFRSGQLWLGRGPKEEEAARIWTGQAGQSAPDKKPKWTNARPVCREYQTAKGCRWPGCKFAHIEPDEKT